jgi:hypothetical protein
MQSLEEGMLRQLGILPDVMLISLARQESSR